ncbi:hypothetical protein [Jonesia denitrificans]|jgi:hypothetical protein|uniref:Acetone carboxylase n=1 Tax=Jonesia denitrificans (strain ATCC 14870 / DSM 20603 / BCRC 15368 / CIP 55.134 / JCM 11481 / NBRC 15587 / NCTC 10816 / Prevot 55134) TaxID=471856 RepID=C7R3W1_JONDD|nr:hypothetical protein [Jonesia denitrificans]ACV08818.1 hypothetical protein Jden_1162 [Jonesia denitrificans DSM 20603]ASE09861.1 hypothetical protein CEP80_12545 [Jonesia denitrificans]QXB44397.1 hypothetical protein I6L70_06185 [Jonesia denitrificans]SQH20807.1 Uncharacterised protein [Jonesia denitrificans]
MTDVLGIADPVDELICSGKGCRAVAVWGLLWNNPKIHTPERRKVWLSCQDHRDHLERFLGARNFLRDTVPVSELDRVIPGDPA